MSDYEKRGYLLENFRLFHLYSQQGTKIDYHYHEFCKLLLLVSGSGSYVVDGQRYLLQPGDAVLINSRSVHKPELEPGIPYERIIIYISPEFLQQQSSPDCDLAGIFSGQHTHVLRPGESGHRKIFSLAAALEQELSREGFGRVILSNAALLQLLVEIGRNQQQTSARQSQAVMPQNSRVLELMRYIDAHLAEDMDIDSLAEQFYISKFHMMRLFHQQTGYTVHSYLSQRRLLNARSLMEKGMRATEACYRSGFRSYSSFTRAYARQFGTTPTGRMDKTREREESYE